MNYKEEIKDLGLTVKFLADKCDVSQTMMSYYVNGTRRIPEDIEREIKRILNAIRKIT